jgi:hypothetical protein
MIDPFRRGAGPLCMLVLATLGAACADSSRTPTAPDMPPLLASGPGSDGDGGGGGGGGDGEDDGGGGGTPTGTGSVQIGQGGTGQGTITSEPAGINCAIGGAAPSGPCDASFPAGTRVRLEAREAPGSQFRGWALTTSCQKAPDVTVVANAVHSCQPVFQPKT